MHWLSILAMFRHWKLTCYGEPLASLISLQTLQDALHLFGYPAVTLFVMIESSGIPFPGETILLLASFYAAIDHQLLLPIIIASAALGAIVGDNLGYYAGRTGGRALIERFGRYLFLKPEQLDRALVVIAAFVIFRLRRRARRTQSKFSVEGHSPPPIPASKATQERENPNSNRKE